MIVVVPNRYTEKSNAMQTSLFSYPITRPYPLRWFTPIALLGGAVLAVLFSLANLAPNGYNLRTVYTTDPNTTATAALDKWFWKAPFNWDSSADPQCESQIVSVGDKFFSSNLGLTYEVMAISQLREGGDRPTVLPSVLYFNNTLENCHMQKVDINLLKEGTAHFWWISWRNSESSATVQCSIVSESGYSNITLRASYKRTGAVNNPYDNVVIYDHVINDNATTHASAWWGTRLIESVWYGVMTSMAYTDRNGSYVSAGVQFYWNETRSPQRSIRENDLFDMSFYFIDTNAVISNDYIVTQDIKASVLTLINNETTFYSPVLTEGLSFAKLFFSLIAVDLGNSAVPNLLLNEDDLQYATSWQDDINFESGGTLDPALLSYIPGADDISKIPPPIALPRRDQYVLINESYALFRPLTGALGTKNATIFTQYLCSVPQPKNTATMLLAILIADLVFLQAAWKLYSWLAVTIVTRRDPTAMSCKGSLSLSNGEYTSVEPKEPDPRTDGREEEGDMSAV
ncbi:hypothetical protein F5Y17DRAFT_427399 [Xylariaceae sp. FL0594]|nr:hypothetical protein F5Y17DRAFT_427399 [Xylariaceae sp. FL0594]